MRKVIEADYGEKLGEVFGEFDEQSVAAASSGQVYRARLHDGREVAVKVQYPGVAQAVRADLGNLGLLLRAAKRIAPGIDPKAMATELRERLTEELDYEHEAQSQRAFGRMWRGHPFVVIPEVVTERSTEHVLVTEYVEGIPFDEVKKLSDAKRNRFGEIVFRFFFGSLWRMRHFSGDPHPGNFLYMDDGRVAFLDFGMTKKVSREQIEAEIDIIRLGLEGDAEGLHEAMGRFGYFDPEDPLVEPERVLRHFYAIADWYVQDREVRLDQAYVGRLMIDMGDPRSEFWSLMRRENLPPDAMLARRMEGLTIGVLGALDVTANWHRIAREWHFGDEPATDLGREEAGFFERGGGRRAGPARAA